ncbi:crosslink repair DNA glycosylase YcaQ family protein [uncultured Microbacterium sp.]|uniref:DNA glycosylase AlkZ-like family protein n=1 Tax=uncultured Microbacterium sp. TaxID=191216 RepID=UPI0026364511|nr:crosslink repair DNA glycosylase YcaQ family protein [uncultured Microbacterium sp.]
MNLDEVQRVLAGGEELDAEFKSDQRKPFSDSSVVEAVVCLANGGGGRLFIGVEDDGTVSGARPRHGKVTDPIRVRAMVANNTVPQVVPDVEILDVEGKSVIVVSVASSETVVGTRNGLYVRRGLGSDGRPACLPFLAHEMLADRISRGEVDFAAIPEPGASLGDLDPAEFERFRTLAAAASGSTDVMSELGDEELLSALGVAERREGRLLLKRGAILLFGYEGAIRRFVPTHETAFQVLERGVVIQNQIAAAPLLRSAERLYDLLRSVNSQDEVMVGLIRVGIDRIPEVVARELVANALVHRDYTRMGMVSVQVADDELTIVSPGGFPRGVTLENFLESSNPRSRIFAEAFKRAGIVDRAGRGINRVFEASLRAGRPEPDYTRSSAERVSVSMQLGGTDSDLVRFVVEHDDRAGRRFDLVDLQIVRALKEDPRLSAADIADILQRPLVWTKARLATHLEEGLIEMRGDGRGRKYTLSAATYRRLASAAGYVRVRAFDEPQQRQMILNYVQANGSISRSEAAELSGTAPEAARRVLLRMRDEGALELRGERRAARYYLP